MKHPSLALSAALLFVCATLRVAWPATLSYTSGEQSTAVLELYTSEGCNSCPPAERWLSALKEQPELWIGVIPMAFHVDYWDGLGWSDPFAKPGYGARQRDYQRYGRTSAVYTPGFIVAGQEWRGWFHGQPLTLPSAPRVGRLSLHLQGDELTLTLDAPRQQTGLKAHVARLGFGLRTAVPRGENAGRTLEHDFVVLRLQQASARGANRWQARLEPDGRGERQAIVAWLSDADSPAPYQAVGGWLPQPAEGAL